MALDRKYGRVTTEMGNIGDKELVFIMRAEDKHVPAMLEHYLSLCAEGGSPQEHITFISEQVGAFRDWQETNGSRIPGMPRG